MHFVSNMMSAIIRCWKWMGYATMWFYSQPNMVLWIKRMINHWKLPNSKHLLQDQN